MSKASKKIFIAGHNEIVLANRNELDLLDQASVNSFFKLHKFDEIYLAAAKVGGIYANSNFPAEFIYENLMIQCNIISAAHTNDINKILFLGSSCIYPKLSKQPMTEDCLLSSKLEPSNEPYAIAKIAGIKLCESFNRQYQRDYRSVMPTNLYGPNDNFHPKNSHVIPGLIRRFHDAKISNNKNVEVWGTGIPKREFLHVDDMAKGSIFIMNLDKDILEKNISPSQSHINIGSGEEISIDELIKTIKGVVQYKGEIAFNSDMPDGTLRKFLSVNLIKKLGWSHSINLRDGLDQTYNWFIENYSKYRS